MQATAEFNEQTAENYQCTSFPEIQTIPIMTQQVVNKKLLITGHCQTAFYHISTCKQIQSHKEQYY